MPKDDNIYLLPPVALVRSGHRQDWRVMFPLAEGPDQSSAQAHCSDAPGAVPVSQRGRHDEEGERRR